MSLKQLVEEMAMLAALVVAACATEPSTELPGNWTSNSETDQFYHLSGEYRIAAVNDSSLQIPGGGLTSRLAYTWPCDSQYGVGTESILIGPVEQNILRLKPNPRRFELSLGIRAECWAPGMELPNVTSSRETPIGTYTISGLEHEIIEFSTRPGSRLDVLSGRAFGDAGQTQPMPAYVRVGIRALGRDRFFSITFKHQNVPYP
jgi:hypothetical protein